MDLLVSESHVRILRFILESKPKSDDPLTVFDLLSLFYVFKHQFIKGDRSRRNTQVHEVIVKKISLHSHIYNPL